MKYYKILQNDGTCANGGTGRWNLPTKNSDWIWEPGEWMPEITGELEPCRHGYHLCRPGDLVYWLDEAIFEAEFEGEMIECDDKVVVREARLLRKIEKWNKRTSILFSCACAEHVLGIFENKYPDDKRPREAIKVAKLYAYGEKTSEELYAASNAAKTIATITDGAAATASAYSATYAASNDDNWSASIAARAAAEATSLAIDNDENTIFNTYTSVKSACNTAASTSTNNNWLAEREWQTETLLKMIGEETDA